MLRFPNPGSNIESFVAVFRAAYIDLCDKSITIDDLVSVTIRAGLATSSGFVGKEAVRRSTREDRSLDPLYNQMKMYAELFRTMGWLHPTAEKRLVYRFTLLGKQLVEAGNDYWPLLRQCALGIAYPTRTLEVKSGAELRPFASILKAAQNCGGYISRDEMIIGPLSASIDKTDDDMSAICQQIMAVRESPEALQEAMNSLSESRGIQANTLRNYTRWPIGLLRDSGWMLTGKKEYADNTLYNAFTLTDAGQEVAKSLNNSIDLRLSDVESLSPDARIAISRVSHFQMLERSGFDIDPFRKQIGENIAIASSEITAVTRADKTILFSPFQALSSDDIKAAFPVNGDAPDSLSTTTLDATSPVSGRDDRTHLFVKPQLVKAKVETEAKSGEAQSELISLMEKHSDIPSAIDDFVNRHAKDTQNEFYPLVANLFNIIGFKCEYSRPGDNYQRWDACVWVGGIALPVEIKSPTEEAVLATKAIRQAIENKVILLSRKSLPATDDSSSLIVGYRIPNERGDMSNLIDNVSEAFSINIGVIDLPTLVHLALRRMRDEESIDGRQLLNLRGFLNV